MTQGVVLTFATINCHVCFFSCTSGAPVLTGSTTVRVMEVGLGRTFDLHCQVTNDPLALDRVRFTWFFNNRRVFARRPKIRIRQRLQSDNGSRVTGSILQVCMCLSGAQEDEGEPATVHINRHMHTHLDCVHIRTYVRTYVADALMRRGASLYSVCISVRTCWYCM